ncbi:MAG: hypothetical protein CM15mP77_0400 [Synechococcus sp.]|nr:MAG: hypothetical protein CM15mP77_0400 [Synechococcus sp.]
MALVGHQECVVDVARPEGADGRDPFAGMEATRDGFNGLAQGISMVSGCKCRADPLGGRLCVQKTRRLTVQLAFDGLHQLQVGRPRVACTFVEAHLASHGVWRCRQ